MEQHNRKILGVDPGEKRIGLAIADADIKLATPLCVLNHISREKNAENIIHIATQNNVDMIVIGQAINEDGNPSSSGRKALRLGDMIKTLSTLNVGYWDESYSTNDAIKLKKSNEHGNKIKGHMDEVAAAIILQSYLDSNI